jgi:hypothetical protein
MISNMGDLGGAPRLEQAVGAPRRRTRVVLGVGVALAVAAVWVGVEMFRVDAGFAFGPQCSPALVDTAVADPGMTEVERAMCYGLAGRISDAHIALGKLSERDRAVALAGIFSLADATADAGHDEAVVDQMELVIEYDPNNFQALFHAGIAEAHRARGPLATQYLNRFLALYPTEDGWRARAKAALAQLQPSSSCMDCTRERLPPGNFEEMPIPPSMPRAPTATPRPTRVVVSAAAASGDRTAEEIQRVMLSRIGVFRACFQKELNRSPGIGGKIVERFEIAADGHVTSAGRTASSTMFNDAVQDCIDSNVKRLRFPVSTAAATVQIPMMFQNGTSP